MKIMNKKVSGIVLAVSTLCAAQSASAEIVQYSFLHSQKGVLTATEPTGAADYLSASNQIHIDASAGLDQKIRVSFLNSNDELVTQQISTVISANDRILVNGRSYYGKRLTLKAPIEGAYTVKQEILSTSDDVIQTSTKNIVIDTTAPTMGSMTGSKTSYGQVITGDIWKLGTSASGANQLYANEVDDNNSIKETYVTVYREDGSVNMTRRTSYDVVTKKSAFVYTHSFFPNSDLDELFNIKVTAVDLAGNETSTYQKAYFDNIGNSPTEPYAIYDPTSSSTIIAGQPGMVKYVSGMTVKTNPVQLIYKLEKNNWHKYRQGGLSFANTHSPVTEVATDSEHTYIHLSAPFGNFSSNSSRWTNFGAYGGGSAFRYNLKLDPNADKTPRIISTEYKFSDIGWKDYRHYYVYKDRLPIQITDVRINAEARNFEQKFYHPPVSCLIPAGETSCETAYYKELNLGTTGYLHGPSYVTKPDNSLQASPTWAEVHWNDQHYPSVTTEYDSESNKIKAFITQPGRGAYFDRLKLNSTWLIDGLGNKINITGRKIEENDTNYVYEWDMKGLPEGKFDISVVAKENHGPETTEFALSIDSDRTAPTVKIGLTNNTQTIKTLDEVVITAYDSNSDIEFKSIRLQGGPLKEDVYLASRKLGSSNQYSLLYPVLFPSELAGDEYTLTVTVVDEQGNESTATQKLKYTPLQVKLDGDTGLIRLPNLATQVRRENGENAIYSNVLKLGDGTPVRGLYSVYVTLRADAVGSVIVGGVTVAPGQTKTITEAYNFDLNKGKYNLTLVPTNTEINSTGSLLIGSTAPNAPVLVANYLFVDLNSEVNVNTTPMAIIDDLNASVKLTNLTDNFCQSLTLNPDEAKSSDIYLEPTCLVTYDISAARKKTTSNGLSTNLSAFMPSLSHKVLKIKVSAFGYKDTKLDIAEYEYRIEPTNPDGEVKSSLTIEADEFLHEIELVEFTAQFDSFAGCDITGDRGVAIHYGFDITDNNGKTKCLLEWSSLPQGLNKIGSSVKVKGYAENLGTENISWTLSVFHSGDEEIIISSGTEAKDVVVPESPSLISTTLIYSNGTKTSGVDHLLRDSKAFVKNIQFDVSPRNYVQIVKYDEFTCTIPEGIDECRVTVDIKPLGDKLTVKKGVIQLTTTIDSSIPYFEPRNDGEFIHNLNWDYTPPKLVDVIINNKKDGSVITKSFNGTEFSLAEDEAAIILFSPFTNINDESWMLNNSTLSIHSDEEIKFEQSVHIDRNHFFFIHDKINLDKGNRISSNDVNVYGNYIVYRYKLTSLPDGVFTFDVDLRDKYTNGEGYTHEKFIMQRSAPEIQLSYLRDKIRMVDGIYFASDFGAVTNPGWDNNNTIIEATFGGENLKLVDDAADPRKNVKFFEGALSTLTAGKEYPLVIKAVDTAGNIGVMTKEFTYAPSFFNIKSNTGISELYQSVQRGTVYISQSRYLCNYVASQELAREISRDARKGCYVKVDSLPDGMSPIWQGWALKITGSINDLADNEIEYSAYVVNPDGQEVRVSNESFVWDVKPAETMTFEIAPIIKLDENVYGVIPENPALARYTLENVSGEVNVNVTRGEFSNSEYMAQRTHKPIYEVLGVIRDDDVKSRNAFDRYPLKVEASYNLSPQHKAGTYGEVIVLPSRRVALNLTMESNDVILSNDSVKVTAHMGAWNWQQKHSEYDALKMGEWNIYLAYKNNKGIEQRISDTKSSDDNGQADFNLNIEDIFRKSNGFYAVAEVKSPHPEYTLKLNSTPIFMRIVLGTGVSGKLASNQVRGKVPFTTLVRYAYDTIEDMVAGNDTVWLKSTDNVTWTEMEEYSGRSAIPFFVQEAGDYYVKAKVTNKNTNESTTSEALKVTGYDKANLVIKGPTQVYAGQDVNLKMFDYVSELTDYDGVAQWSRDSGATWFDGSPQQILVAKDEQEVVLGRFKYHTSTAGAGDEAWALSRFYLRPVGPRTVMAQIKATHLVELGVPINIEAQVLNLNGGVDLPIIYKWHKPNGETSDEVMFEYTPKESDLDPQGRLNFKLSAWVKGYKTETFRETQRNLETWKYVFPEMNISVRSNILVAPATITGMIEMQRKFMPGITHEYEWLESDDIEVRSPTRLYSEITIKKAGVQELRAKVTDSRGMSRILSTYVDVIEPDETGGAFIYFPSNRFSRAPLGLVTRAQMTGGHPRDYIIDYKWFINGQEQETLQSRSPMYRFEIEEPGNYEIKSITTSQYGQVTEVIENYTVNANKLPECASNQVVRSGTIRITANCTDKDGYVIGYDWWFNGEYIGRGAASTQLRLSEYPSMTVDFEAVDDAGGRTKGSFSW